MSDAEFVAYLILGAFIGWDIGCILILTVWWVQDHDWRTKKQKARDREHAHEISSLWSTAQLQALRDAYNR